MVTCYFLSTFVQIIVVCNSFLYSIGTVVNSSTPRKSCEALDVDKYIVNEKDTYEIHCTTRV